MAKVKLALDTNRPNKSGEYSVIIQLSSKGDTLKVVTGIKVLKENWIQSTESVLGGKKGDSLASYKNIELGKIKSAIDEKLILNSSKVKTMTVHQLRDFILGNDEGSDTDFFKYCDKRIHDLENQGRNKTAMLLGTVKNKISVFWPKPYLDMNEINVRWLEQFVTYCKSVPEEGEDRKQMTQNGVASYLRYLRSLINDAIDDGIIESYPFRKFKIRTEVTRKRNVTLDDICIIRDFPAGDRRVCMARDMWMLMFYLSGISPKDLFLLEKTDEVNGRIEYNRSKTRMYYNIKIEPEARELIDRYAGNKYLLMFADTSINREPGKKHTRKTVWQWKNEEQFSKMIRMGLKVIQENSSLTSTQKITAYNARHSVATIMRTIGVSKDDIALVLGHSRPELHVTSVYVEEDFLRSDRAVRLLLDELKKCAVRVSQVVIPPSPSPDCQ